MQCRFLFCFQAKEEIKLSKMDGRNSAEADGTACLEVERCQRRRLGGLARDPRVAIPSGEGGWVRQGTAPSRGTSPSPWVDSEHVPSRAPAPLNHAQRKREFRLKDPRKTRNTPYYRAAWGPIKIHHKKMQFHTQLLIYLDSFRDLSDIFIPRGLLPAVSCLGTARQAGLRCPDFCIHSFNSCSRRRAGAASPPSSQPAPSLTGRRDDTRPPWRSRGVLAKPNVLQHRRKLANSLALSLLKAHLAAKPYSLICLGCVTHLREGKSPLLYAQSIFVTVHPLAMFPPHCASRLKSDGLEEGKAKA